MSLDFEFANGIELGRGAPQRQGKSGLRKQWKGERAVLQKYEGEHKG